jgi:trimeric autotransporter adhesin
MRLFQAFSGAALSSTLALGFVLAVSVATPQAQAQFLCVNTAASADGATATGGTQSVACGTNANASGPSGLNSAFGRGANASGNASDNTAIGNAANASGDNLSRNVALGANASATGNNSSNIAIGLLAHADGNGTNNTAVGTFANATGANSSAFGNLAAAGFANSTAIGANATATQANQVAVGTATNTYKLAGITSATSLAAQTGPTKVVTTDAFGNLAAASFTPQDISGLQSNVSALQQNVSVLQTQMRQAFEGTAIAIALGGASLPADKRFAISTNWGNFRGQNAVGVAAQMRLTDYAVANVGVGGGFAQGGFGSRAGVTLAW